MASATGTQLEPPVPCVAGRPGPGSGHRGRRESPPTRGVWRLMACVAVASIVLGASFAGARPVAAADGPTMSARAQLAGHTRVGSWLGIAVDVTNDGPGVTGELRLDAGSGTTSYSTPVDLPTQSRKRYVLYAQPPSGFGAKTRVLLTDQDGRVLASQPLDITSHDANQLLVGVVAEKSGPIVAGLGLPVGATGIAPATVALSADDLPDRAEAWAPLDRLVWQDTDAAQLSGQQVDALRGWVAAGGRLIIIGGTNGAGALSAFPDDLLPYRPAATVDVASSALAGLLGPLPGEPTEVPALAGTLTSGRALATSGGQAIAAERTVGSGIVTLLGFDPSASWLAGSTSLQSLWRRLLPARTSSDAGGISDDSQLVSAVATLPSLALPPLGGLIAILAAYIVLIGPLTYLILRRLDRREWAWVTMPALIGLFAIGAYGYGSAVRGTDVIVNEVAVVRGQPDTVLGQARVYLGVFSPTRGTYQLSVPGGALLSAPINADAFGGSFGTTGPLDVVQGDPARVRDLAIGFGSLRAVRAETTASVPRVTTDLRMDGGRVVGTITNESDQTLQRPALVFGSSSVVMGDLAPGQKRDVSLTLDGSALGQMLSDRIVGQNLFGGVGASGEQTQRLIIRHAIIDQLTFDPSFGFSGSLPADGPVLLAWGDRDLVDVQIDGHQTRRASTDLYDIPVTVAMHGDVVFGPDLMRSSVLASDAAFFSKDPSMINFGSGSVTMSYRPIGLSGGIDTTALRIALGFSPDATGFTGGGRPINAGPPTCDPSTACPSPDPDAPAQPSPSDEVPGPPDSGIPVIALFDLQANAWRTLPGLQGGGTYAVTDPARFVDPVTGTVLVRFDSKDQNGIGFAFGIRLEGRVR